jgi:hypothetical protein
MGVDYGDAELIMPSGPSNPHGFFEYKQVLDINEEIIRARTLPYVVNILDQFGMNQEEIDSLIKTRFWCACHAPILNSDGIAASIGDKISRILAELSGDTGFIVLKDTRLCMTLALWMPYIDIIPIVLYRNPADSSKSIQRMSGIPLNYAYWLWAYYTHASVMVSAELSPHFISFDELCESPVKVSLHLKSFLQARGLALQVNEDLLNAAFDMSLIHTSLPDNNIPLPVKKLFEWIKGDKTGAVPDLPESHFSIELLPLVSICQGLVKHESRYTHRINELNFTIRKLRERLDWSLVKICYERFKALF